MLQLKTAMELTTSHGLPRVVTNKPLYVRLLWLLMFLFMLALFIKGFYEFAVKLQSRQVTNTLEANSLNFQFPDVYVCFENAISGSYSANIDAKSADLINAQLTSKSEILHKSMEELKKVITGADEKVFSFSLIQSLEYRQLIDILAHRLEQSVLDSKILFRDTKGLLQAIYKQPITFYHPMYLRCFKWVINDTEGQSILRSVYSAGISTTLMVDDAYSDIPSSGGHIKPMVYIDNIPIPVSNWFLSSTESISIDRRSGVRVYLTQPGEYPTDFVKSFFLGAGKHHTVEIGMIQQVYKDGQFECVSDAPDVQFVNPYDQSPYNHAYSYSYCYYYEYHKAAQTITNMSGEAGPIPWLLRGRRYLLNLTGDPNIFILMMDRQINNRLLRVIDRATETCSKKRTCSTFDYSVSISSADWPTQSSLAPFVRSTINQAWASAKSNNLSVPALDFLLTANDSSVASYVRSNLLKVHFIPGRVLCDSVTFSIDYGLQNFISDIGGIMGIYLGMSLLTMCELLELIYDLIAFYHCKSRTIDPNSHKSDGK